jgi:hypothetical protein
MTAGFWQLRAYLLSYRRERLMATIDHQPDVPTLDALTPDELDAACGGTTVVQTFTQTGTLTIVFSGETVGAVFNPNLRLAR